MRTQLLTAHQKLRNSALAQEGMVLVVQGGQPDKAIRVLPLPKFLEEQVIRSKKQGKSWVELFLDTGPDLEAWRDLEREIFLRAPRDQAMPRPIAVANGIREEWSLNPEDIPVVRLHDTDQVPVEDAPEEVKLETRPVYKCQECPRMFDKASGLRMHIRNRHITKKV